MTKKAEGLLRYERLDGSYWCFDMGYQILSTWTGMRLWVQLGDRYQRMQLEVLPNHRLRALPSGKKRYSSRSYELDRNVRYLAWMDADEVDKIVYEAMEAAQREWEAAASEDAVDQTDDSDDLPF